MGYDGSPAAARAIDTGARLLPGHIASVVHLWSAPFPDSELRDRLGGRGAISVQELMSLLEHEGAELAELTAADGVALARAAGWQAHARTHRSHGGQGFELAGLAEELRPAAVVLGSRGMSGLRAALGSITDAAVHYSPVPVLVVPPLLSAERRAAEIGPVLVGDDGSTGARNAIAAAVALFGERDLLVAAVDDDQGRAAAEHSREAPNAETVVLDGVGWPRRGERAVSDALTQYAARRDAALIVVGSRGRSAPREIMLGSVAMAVLHHAHRPVLVVPRPEGA